MTAILLVLLGSFGSCRTRPDFNAKMARRAKAAMVLAKAARRRNDAAYIWPGRPRMISTAASMIVSTTDVVVFVWTCVRHHASDLDLVVFLEQ